MHRLVNIKIDDAIKGQALIMEYIINQSIVFSSTGRTLSILNEEDLTLTLSNPSSRLLVELIRNNRNTVTRNFLLQKVWEDYGLNGSNNNLNGCISEIRKSFEALGIDSQILTTLPKVGFILDANLEPDTRSSNKNIVVNEENSCQVNGDNSIQASSKMPFTAHFSTLGMILTISCCGIAFIWILMQKQPHEFNKSDIYYLYNYGQCKVFSIDPPGTYSKKELVQQADTLLQRKSINCENPIGDIFYSKRVSRYTPIQMTFIAICSPPQQGKYRNCRTIKDIDGTVP